MKSDLTSGEVEFTLINDFRPLAPIREISGEIGFSGSSLVNVAVPVPNGVYKATIDITGTGVISISETELFEDTRIDIVIPENTNLIYTLITEEGNYLIGERGEQIVNEEGTELVYTIPITYEYYDGTIETTYLQIIQQG
jgi:hypothetical protein